MMDRTESGPDAALELRCCVAVAGHPDIVQVLDVALFHWNPTGLDQPRIALVFERFAASVGDLLTMHQLELAVVRHILAAWQWRWNCRGQGRHPCST